MDEIDEIWELELFGNFSHWISKETYDEIRGYLIDSTIDKSQTGIAVTTLNGAEVVLLLSNISNLTYSNKEIRVMNRERNKEYKKEWEEKKEAWEE